MNCLCARSRLLARRLTQLYEARLAPVALTPAQFELLAELFFRPHQTQTALAHALALDQTTLSRNLALLLGRRLVERNRSAQDRRTLRYTLSPTGLTLWQQALPLWESAQHTMQQALGDRWLEATSMLTTISQAAIPLPNQIEAQPQ